MFGTKLRTWMEAHIVRPKKKKDRKKSDKGGFDSNCNSPGSHSANRSPGLHQVYPLDSTAKNVDTIILNESSLKYTNGNTNTSTATSGGTGSVNLSSPESAYSTGYSTDGTSPGASYPPEYYINIRTGTHYFQSNKTRTTTNKRPGLADSCVANVTENEKLNDDSPKVNVNTIMTKEKQLLHELRTNIPFKNGEIVGIKQVQSKQPQYYKNIQPHKNEVQQHNKIIDSYSSVNLTMRNSLPVSFSTPQPIISTSMIQSPRQRSRIRTNPWLSANSSSSSTTGGCGSGDNDAGIIKSHLKYNDITGSTSDLNLYNHINGNTRRDYRQDSLSVGRSPINQSWRMSPRIEARSNRPMTVLRRSNSSSSNSSSSTNNSSSSSSVSSITQSIRSSEDDITLNEMMGKFDESYVYEKETDILSDSDPTDCEDYVNHSPSDVDTGQDGGDENDQFENDDDDDDDFDYIDNGSFIDLNNIDGAFPNTGHCTYFTFTSELTRRSTRLRESILKRRCKDDIQQRIINTRSNTKRSSMRYKKQDDKISIDKNKKRQSQRKKQINDKCNDVTANLNRVLVERMLLKNSGFNQGSRSVGGTPICLRRRKQNDINENISMIHQNSDPRNFINPNIIDNEILKRRSNSISYVNDNLVEKNGIKNSYMTTFASEIALIEADKEADRKYRELINEAENILINMKNNTSIVIPSPIRRIHNGLANKRVELIKNAELNIEFALSKSRNSQPELQCGNIKDLEHTSPKRFIDKTNQYYLQNNHDKNINGIIIKDNGNYKNDIKCPDSPIMSRKTPQVSPSRNLLQNKFMLEDRERSRTRIIQSNEFRSFSQERNIQENFINAQNLIIKKDVMRIKDDIPTSSSSDSDDRYDQRGKNSLMTFRSIDMRPIKESTYYCPQSEPVKRKVYAGSSTYGRIQKTLGEKHVILRSSDGDTATDDTDDSRRSLKEKVAQLRQERIEANANLNFQDSQIYQNHLTQLRRQMLMHTIEGLKRSLEDQSATLKQTCLKETIMHD